MEFSRGWTESLTDVPLESADKQFSTFIVPMPKAELQTVLISREARSDHQIA